MSKLKFVQRVAKRGNLSKAEAKRVVELVFSEIGTCLKKDLQEEGRVPIGTFGTFYIGRRKERFGRHPRTGKLLKIKESHSLKFRPSSHLKKAAGFEKPQVL